MSQSARLRNIIALLEASRLPVPRQTLLAELQVSPATFKRDLDILRDQMQAPIVWIRAMDGLRGGYVLQDKDWSAGRLGLPHAWFTASEIHALLMIDQLARHIGPGLLTEHLQPLIARITLALSAANDAPDDIRSRVHIMASASKRKPAACFETVARATVQRKRLQIGYFTRSRNLHSERRISPQRLIHYRENWYLSAWCHRADSLRMFALDSMDNVCPLSDPAREIPAADIDRLIGHNFGLFATGQQHWAKLLFTPEQARWVADEVWHPNQSGSIQPDGSYLLAIPYGDSRELMLEILRFGPDVEVLEPTDLRKAIAERLQAAAARYL